MAWILTQIWAPLLLLVLATSASAECACVLWEEHPVTSGGVEFGYGEGDRLPNEKGA